MLLALYPIALGLILPQFLRAERGTLLPESTRGLLAVALGELVIFGLVFGLAWVASRASLDQLLLRWGGGLGPIWRGLLYSVALRIAIAAGVVVVALAALAAGGDVSQLLNKARPKTEVVVNPAALQDSPLYFFLTLTLISFVVAGLREELWRAGMLAGLRELWPNRFGGRLGQVAGVLVAAVVFGLGHWPQGWGGAVVTAGLGLGLGLIMVRRQSIWDAVFAHGFFNATTFVMLYGLSRWYPGLVPGS